MELDSIEAAKKMVERGLGVALLPGTAVAREVEGGTLSVVAMQDAPPMHNSIVVFRRRDAADPAGIVAAVLELLGTHTRPIPHIAFFDSSHPTNQLDFYRAP